LGKDFSHKAEEKNKLSGEYFKTGKIHTKAILKYMAYFLLFEPVFQFQNKKEDYHGKQ